MVNGLDGQWRPTLWLVFAYSILLLVVIVCLADETWYDRTLAVQPERQGGAMGRINDLIGVTAYRQRAYKAGVWSSVMRLVEVSRAGLRSLRECSKTSAMF